MAYSAPKLRASRPRSEIKVITYLTHKAGVQHNLGDLKPFQIVSLLDMLHEYAYTFVLVVRQVEELISELGWHVQGKRLEARLEDLLHKIQDDLENRSFLYIPNERKDYFDQSELFGAAVAVGFPHAN